MALKFLNKKGWHTGSLRNIENVWKAEQKHDAEQKKLEELRKQIQDERERSEFRLLQEQAGLVPKQERLEFLYDSGLAVGKTSGSSSGGGVGVAFKSLEESIPGSTTTSNNNNAPSSSAQQSSVPGALFEDKPHSSNDTWRKLHSDPLLLIRQREQEAIARVKNNPVQMAMIRKSVEASKEKEVNHDSREHQKKHSHSKGKHHKHSSKLQSDSENVGGEGERRRKNSDHKHSSFKDVRVEGEKRRKNSDRMCSKYDEHHYKAQADSDGESSERENQKGRNSYRGSKYRERSHGYPSPKSAKTDFQDAHRKNHGKLMNERYSLEGRTDFHGDRKGREVNSSRGARSYASSESAHYDSNYRRRNVASRLTEEERLAKLREMQVDAELHEEQRWKRLRKAEEDDVREATQTSKLGGRNFLDAAHKSVYGAEKGGSSTIEESVRRRSHYSQGRSEVGDGNAFRR